MAEKEHDFEGVGPYCEFREVWPTITGPEGTLSGSNECGWPESSHPNADPVRVQAKEDADEAWRLQNMGRTRDRWYYRDQHEFLQGAILKAVAATEL